MSKDQTIQGGGEVGSDAKIKAKTKAKIRAKIRAKIDAKIDAKINAKTGQRSTQRSTQRSKDQGNLRMIAPGAGYAKRVNDRQVQMRRFCFDRRIAIDDGSGTRLFSSSSCLASVLR